MEQQGKACARAPCLKKLLYIDFKSAQIDESRCSHCLLLLRKWLKSCPSVKLSKKLKRKTIKSTNKLGVCQEKQFRL